MSEVGKFIIENFKRFQNCRYKNVFHLIRVLKVENS